jgi:hypothetical protein
VRIPAAGGWRFRDGAELVAEAVVCKPVDGIGTPWWISVEPAARGRGPGLALLGSALELLQGLRGREVIAYVDDNAPIGTGRRRTGSTTVPAWPRSTAYSPTSCSANSRGNGHRGFGLCPCQDDL